MDKQIFGYLRVSSQEQHEDRQRDAMLQFGVSTRNLYTDKQSGKDFNRPAYRKLLRRLKPGDTLVIKSVDRLGRNYEEVLEQWRMITVTKKVAIVVLDMPLLDTRNKNDLTGTLIANIVLQLLSYFSEKEREFIHQRQAEGIKAAKARGVRFGRPPKERSSLFQCLCEEWKEGAVSARQAARELKISHATFLNWVREQDRHIKTPPNVATEA